MELLEFIKSLSPEGLETFAVDVGTTVPHLRNVAYGARVASAALAAQIQVHSGGKVQVATLRPKDWHLVWGAAVNQTMHPPGIVAEGDGTMAGGTATGQRMGDGHAESLGGAADSVHVNAQPELTCRA